MATYTSAPKVYANALRSYTPHTYTGTTSGGPTSMAPHLSQPNPLDADISAAYKEFLTDPQAKQYEQHGMDVDRIWRTSPNAALFKPGYEHNQYVLQRAAALRAARTPQAAGSSLYDAEGQLQVPSRYVYNAEGEQVDNPAYRQFVTQRSERNSSDD